MIDVIVVGAGIAGSCCAYALKERGLRVLVLEKASICSGGSLGAGAFLSPKISKPSPYKTYLNDALSYSLAFYEKHFPHLLLKNGLLKLPLDAEDGLRCQSYEPYIDFPWEKRHEAYFFPQAGLIPAQALCLELLRDIDVVESYEVKSVLHEENMWHIDNRYSAKHLIFATGDSPEPLDLPYLKSKKIGGYRYDVRFSGFEKQHYNIHKDISISTALHEYLIVGATHIREAVDLASAAREDSHNLIQKAQQILPMPDLEILKSYTGYRRFSFDYFPFVGAVVDAAKTVKAFPYISSGAKVPFEKYRYYPNLYIHAALGSRGFVFAPYNAMLLAEKIVADRAIPHRLLPALRFQKWIRKREKVS